jgi:hypothetical protein
MQVIHRVPNKFTTHSRHVHDKLMTKNLSRWISFNFVRDTFTTRSRQISTHDSFAPGTRQDKHVWSCRELIANESWSRLCCRRFGQYTSRMPSCDFYAVRRHHVILLAKTFSWRRNKADSVGDIFFRWIIFEVTSLPHDSLVYERVVNLSWTRWITRIRLWSIHDDRMFFKYFF